MDIESAMDLYAVYLKLEEEYLGRPIVSLKLFTSTDELLMAIANVKLKIRDHKELGDTINEHIVIKREDKKDGI